MLLLARHASDKIFRLLDVFPAVLVVGARQSGKTSLCKSLFPDWSYFDLELEGDTGSLLDDPELFFRQYESRVVFDEAQEFPELFRTMRSVIDAERSAKGRFVITGSSSPALMSEAADSLAGRIGIVELGTFTLSERLNLQISPFFSLFSNPDPLWLKEKLLELKPRTSFSDLTSFMTRGGYPEPALFDNDEHWKAWMSNYVRTFIARDVGRLFPRLDSRRFTRFVRLLGSVSGRMINKADIAAAIGVSEPVVSDYLDIADNTFLWRTIPSFHRNKIKSVIKSPKGIVRDCGLGNFFRGYYNIEQLIHSVAVGPAFEAFVAEELIKGFSYALLDDVSIYHFRTRAGSEVDLVFEGGFGLLPVEVKFSSSTSLRELTGLRNFIDRHNLPIGLVINNSTKVQLLHENIIQLPAAVL